MGVSAHRRVGVSLLEINRPRSERSQDVPARLFWWGEAPERR